MMGETVQQRPGKTFRTKYFGPFIERQVGGGQCGRARTSGHGVCGLGQFSARSLVATLTFMAVAAATVFIIRSVAGG